MTSFGESGGWLDDYTRTYTALRDCMSDHAKAVVDVDMGGETRPLLAGTLPPRTEYGARGPHDILTLVIYEGGEADGNSLMVRLDSLDSAQGKHRSPQLYEYPQPFDSGDDDEWQDKKGAWLRRLLEVAGFGDPLESAFAVPSWKTPRFLGAIAAEDAAIARAQRVLSDPPPPC